MFSCRDFPARQEKYVMKNEKWIVFPESRYVNSNPEFCKLCHYTLKLKIIMNFFFAKQYFSLNSNPVNVKHILSILPSLTSC